MNKIEDSNIIIGQQQIEALDQIINIFKNKNKVEKIFIIEKGLIKIVKTKNTNIFSK
jgi:hypothetical protein